jgi:hypothetical protein
VSASGKGPVWFDLPIAKVMQDHLQLFANRPPIPADFMIGPGFVFRS